MTEETVRTALARWNLGNADCRLVAARENRVYRVEHAGKRAALRLHRPGYRRDAELSSELQWMAALADGGLTVPAPIAAQDGGFLHRVDGVQVDLLTWLDGVPLGASGVPLEHPDRKGLFAALGRAMARLHEISDAWKNPADFDRWAWDLEGLVGDAPLWGRFWENPTLGSDDRALFEALRQAAEERLAAEGEGLDYGLIHADLVRENVLVGEAGLQLIDFDDGGFGFRLFDIATGLFKNRAEPDYADLEASLIAGYRSMRPIDTRLLPLFMALRAATYVGWIVERLDEPGGEARNCRFIRAARELAEAVLGEG